MNEHDWDLRWTAASYVFAERLSLIPSHRSRVNSVPSEGFFFVLSLEFRECSITKIRKTY